jgi:hypothetical protein
MYRLFYYLIQPGVVSTGLMGTALQVGLAFANTFNVAGAADVIANYGLNGQLASGGLIAALTGIYYSLTRRGTGRAVATSAGAVAGGISGTLGTALTQTFGWTEVAEGATPLLNFSAIVAALTGAADAGVRFDGRRRRHRCLARPLRVRRRRAARPRLRPNRRPCVVEPHAGHHCPGES